MNATLHILDWSCLAVLFAGAVLGMMTGFIRQITRLLTYLAASAITAHFQGHVTDAVNQRFADMNLLTRTSEFLNSLLTRGIGIALTFSAAYLTLFLATRIVVSLIKCVFLKPEERSGSAIHGLGLGLLDRLGGMLLGTTLAAALAFPVVLGVCLYPSPSLQQSLAGSHVQPIAVRAARSLRFALPEDTKTQLEDAFRGLEATLNQAGQNLSNQGLQEILRAINQFRGDTANSPLAKSGFADDVRAGIR